METELVYLEARVMALVGRMHELQRDNAILHETLLKNKEECALLQNETQELQVCIKTLQADKVVLLSVVNESVQDIRQLMGRLPIPMGETNE